MLIPDRSRVALYSQNTGIMSHEPKQTITITDIPSSVRHLQKRQYKTYMGWINDDNVKFVWVGRHHAHTTEEIADGKHQNPEVRTMPIDDFSALLGKVTPEKNVGETIVLWPSRNTIHFGCSICIPAYTENDGVDSEYVTVAID